MFVRTYSKGNAKSQAKLNTQLLLRTVTEDFKAHNRRSSFSHLSIPGRGVGLPTEGVGGFSGPKDKPDTDGQPNLTCRVLVQVRDCMTYNFGLDAMNNLKRAYLAIQSHLLLIKNLNLKNL
jgi:hypothetical protein